jgi:hypothetical protein
MDYQNIGKGIGGRRRACALSGGTLIAATAICLGVTGTAHASAAPTASLSFSPTTIIAGTQPQMTFLSSNVPSGSVLYLEESADGGRQWKTVDKTTSTQGTSLLSALSSEGVYEFRIVITDNNATIGESVPATVTVTGADGQQPTAAAPAASAPAPAPTPAAAPSSSGVPWLTMVVKGIWNVAIATLIAIIMSFF